MIAHRGDSAHAPENTLEAGALGHASGAFAWEFDVQLSRDGVPVVFHDPTLDRTTDAPRDRLLSASSLEVLQSLDAGARFLDPRGGPRTAAAFGTRDRIDPGLAARIAAGAVRIPTFDEALALTIDLDWAANVEIKSAHDGDFRLVDAVLATIRRLGVADRILVSSFDHAEVARVVAADLGVATGVLVSHPIHRPGAYVRDWIGAEAYHASTRAIGGDGPSGRLREQDLDDCRAAGVPVLVYTVNPGPGDDLADRLAGSGVAGIFTDDPRGLLARFNRA